MQYLAQLRGRSACLAQAVLQEQGAVLRLFPALPDHWKVSFNLGCRCRYLPVLIEKLACVITA
jgi:hypothetical protein